MSSVLKLFLFLGNGEHGHLFWYRFDILSEIEKFKKDDENRKSFKIEPFDTFHMDEKKNSIYVDFGDYRVFFGIVGHDIDLISEFNKEYFT